MNAENAFFDEVNQPLETVGAGLLRDDSWNESVGHAAGNDLDQGGLVGRVERKIDENDIRPYRALRCGVRLLRTGAGFRRTGFGRPIF